MVHISCRGALYPFSKIARVLFPDNLVPWSAVWPDYNPAFYESDRLINKPWADPKIGDDGFHPKWNCVDGGINRKSYEGEYEVRDGYPLNPRGRTGLRGRGVLGKWGPNHAADPIVSRWKYVDRKKQFDAITKLPILQVCVIERHDTSEWALPGGMVDPGEQVSSTLRREFMEEAMNSLQNDAENEAVINKFFSSGHKVYEGYTDDHRNTDNAWIETVAVNFHDETGSVIGGLSLEAGDDAKNVKWLDISKDSSLYMDHSMFIQRVVEHRQAHW